MVSRVWSAPLSVVDLSGTWTFTPLGASPTTIKVPGGGWYKQGFTTITQADYQTTIAIPDSGQPQITRLELGAVNYEADVYINNALVGTNITSFTPSCFDLTGFVVPGQNYTLRITVKGRQAFMLNGKSTVPNAAGWSPNTPQGIFRSAQLLIYPTVYISDEFVRPSVLESNLYYDVWITNGSSSMTNVTLSGNLTSWNSNSWVYPTIVNQSVSVPAFSTIKTTVGPMPWNLGAASYWWPNVPYQEGYTAQLHNLNLTLTSGTNTINTDTVTFGFRQVAQGSDGTNICYFLNGIRVNFRGDSLQGADYDSINYDGGYGDAYDTLPGFLPGTTNGWPQAVDNYQRLNYNFVRLHQEPVTPYMLQVCDQKGLMVMEETAIRGSNNDQDFINGFNNMVNHLIALFTRDRNHPCIVRQSQSNEPGLDGTDSTNFEINLYNATMSIDGTRPISVDGTFYSNIAYTNFAEFGHYGNGLGQYTQTVWSNTAMPYGQGEFVWPADNTPQGFTWFATGTQAMRQQGASDIRPYTLLSAWTSFVPQVTTTEMTLEQSLDGLGGAHPTYGADNLPDPWTNSQIMRVQAGFNPVLVADSDYWNANSLSDSSGDWPANVSVLHPNQLMTRNLTVYNDTFSGTNVDLSWKLIQDSSAGTNVVASGETNLTVELGYFASTPISFMVPDATNGTTYHLVLSSQKAGVQEFQETNEQFVMVDEFQLSGLPFGVGPPWSVGSEFDKACDGTVSTFYDFYSANGGYTGIDLGAGNSTAISSVTFTPRSGYEPRMVGGTFQGSTDGTNYTTLYTVPTTPSPYTRAAITNQTAFRYLRYVGPANSYCDIAEMAYYHTMPTAWLWCGSDIGNVGAAGVSSQIRDAITVAGSGADIYGTNDAGQFTWQQVSGDCDIRAQLTGPVTGAESTDPYAKAGVMIRETLDVDAKHMSTFLTASNGVQSIWRTNNGGASFFANANGIPAPCWVRMVRSGNTFTSYESPDGINWTQVGSPQTILMATNVYTGLAVTSKQVGQLCVGYFAGVSVISLPTPWQTTDIGNVEVTGSATYSNGVYIVSGSGSDINNTVDAFRYAYITNGGNCDIRAEVTSVGNTDPSAKAGVMIRETLNANAANAATVITPSNSVSFQYRSSPGAVTVFANSGSVTAPYWVRLIRIGNSFAGYLSPDGTNWTQVGSTQTIMMATNVYAGLPVTSHDSSYLCTATLAGITINSNGGITNNSPTLNPTTLSLITPPSNGLIISWPFNEQTNTVGLYYTASLALPVNWILVTNSPVLSNTQWSVALPIGSGSGFYQLRTSN